VRSEDDEPRSQQRSQKGRGAAGRSVAESAGDESHGDTAARTRNRPRIARPFSRGYGVGRSLIGQPGTRSASGSGSRRGVGEERMGIPRVARRRAKISQRAGRRPGAAPVTAIAARRGTKADFSPARPVRHPLNGFVTRWLRSWAAAGASAAEFLATWTPLRLPEAAHTLPAEPRRGGRRSSNLSRRSARRRAQHPAPPASANWTIPLAAAGGAEALRKRYPLVNALLNEIATQPRRRTAVARTQRSL